MTTQQTTKLTANDIAAMFSEGWQSWPTEQTSDVCKPRHYRYLTTKQTSWILDTFRREQRSSRAATRYLADGVLPCGVAWSMESIAYKTNAKLYVFGDAPATEETAAQTQPELVSAMDVLAAERLRRISEADRLYADDDERLDAELSAIRTWFRAEKAKIEGM